MTAVSETRGATMRRITYLVASFVLALALRAFLEVTETTVVAGLVADAFRTAQANSSGQLDDLGARASGHFYFPSRLGGQGKAKRRFWGVEITKNQVLERWKKPSYTPARCPCVHGSCSLQVRTTPRRQFAGRADTSIASQPLGTRVLEGEALS